MQLPTFRRPTLPAIQLPKLAWWQWATIGVPVVGALAWNIAFLIYWAKGG